MSVSRTFDQTKRDRQHGLIRVMNHPRAKPDLWFDLAEGIISKFIMVIIDFWNGVKTRLPPLVVHWPISEGVVENWGDKLNPVLVQWLSGRRVLNVRNHKQRPRTVYLVIGSGLRWARRNYVIWGSGFIATTNQVRERPKKIWSVRGPLTRALLLEKGIECPEVYGDPALLYPLIYSPKIDKKYDLGIIQHFREAGVENLPQPSPGLKVKIINISGGLNEVVDDILSCQRIASSSLHGIIAAHAYGIPAVWLKFSNRPLGDGFKFHDYWSSVGCRDVEPLLISEETTCRTLYEHRCDPMTPIDIEALIACCPFVGEKRKKELSALAKTRIKLGELCRRATG